MPKRLPPCALGQLLDQLRGEEEDPGRRTQQAMAKKLGISPSLLSLWRSGGREPKTDQVHRISQEYDRREDDIWFTLRRYRMPLETAMDFQPPGVVTLELHVTPAQKTELVKYLQFLRIKERLNLHVGGRPDTEGEGSPS